jgi:hypothetical protein
LAVTFFGDGERLTLGLDLVLADVAEFRRAIVVDGLHPDDLKIVAF